MRAPIPVVMALLALVPVPGVVAAVGEEIPEETLWSDLGLEFYGYAKLDTAWDSGEAVPGDFVRWVDLDSADSDKTQFNLTMNETRLGLVIGDKAENDKRLRTTGRIEIDFYGGGGDSRPRPKLRQAYVGMVWPQTKFSLLVGQTGDVISPLFPRTLNYSVVWWAGNIGYRRPQIRLRKVTGIGPAYNFLATAAITKAIDSSKSVFASVDTGADSTLPGIQLHLGLVKKNRQAGMLSIGVSGHWEREEFDIGTPSSAEDFDSWSANLDVEIPITRRVLAKGELFRGENLPSYLGGIGQGVDLDRMIEIGSQGGWASLELVGFSKGAYHLGISTDRVDEQDIGIEGRIRNSSIFANGIWTVHRKVDLGLELSYWQTRYKAGPEADNLRSQLAFIYRF